MTQQTKPSALSLIPDQIVMPEDCTLMTEVRAGVDAIDRHLVELFILRTGYMEAAARIKPTREHVYDQWRVDDVLEKVKAQAEARGLSTAFSQPVWEEIIKRSIAHEYDTYDEVRSD